MTPLRQRMIDDLLLRNRSPRTVDAYVEQVARFARYFGRSPEHLGPDEIRQYQVYLVQERQVSWSNFNQAVCALRFLPASVGRRLAPGRVRGRSALRLRATKETRGAGRRNGVDTAGGDSARTTTSDPELPPCHST